MKNVTALLLLLLLVSSCLKEEECYIGICNWDAYSSETVLNGKTIWQANRCWFGELNNNNGKVIIHLSTVNWEGILRENIRIQNVDLQLGRIEIGSNWPIMGASNDELEAIFDTLISDGDASTEQYRLYEVDDFEHYIEIDYISEDRLTIEGHYEMFFVLDPNGPPKFNEERPDILIFTHGAFRAGKFF